MKFQDICSSIERENVYFDYLSILCISLRSSYFVAVAVNVKFAVAGDDYNVAVVVNFSVVLFVGVLFVAVVVVVCGVIGMLPAMLLFLLLLLFSNVSVRVVMVMKLLLWLMPVCFFLLLLLCCLWCYS